MQYINAMASGGFEAPIINGEEEMVLDDASGIVDGPSPIHTVGETAQRNADLTWTTADEESATPGQHALSAGAGLRLTEVSDGNGDWHMEFVELVYAP